jgi:hypothetical protein
MGNQRIINTGEVFSRLFALGLDTLEIARVFDMREGGVCDVLSSFAASDAHPHPPRSQVAASDAHEHPCLEGSAAQ